MQYSATLSAVVAALAATPAARQQQQQRHQPGAQAPTDGGDVQPEADVHQPADGTRPGHTAGYRYAPPVPAPDLKDWVITRIAV